MTTSSAELLSRVAPVLDASAFRKPTRWAHAVVILRREERRVTSRGDLAGWFAANALPDAARECVRRRVPPGSILVWVEADTEAVAFVGFFTFDLRGALAATARELDAARSHEMITGVDDAATTETNES